MCNFSANLHFLSLSQTEWQNMIISVAKSVLWKQNSILTTAENGFFSHKIYLRCNKINFFILEIILRSQYSRKKSDWYCMILGLSRRLYTPVIL